MPRPTNVERAKREAESESHKKAVPQPQTEKREAVARLRAVKRKEAGR